MEGAHTTAGVGEGTLALTRRIRRPAGPGRSTARSGPRRLDGVLVRRQDCGDAAPHDDPTDQGFTGTLSGDSVTQATQGTMNVAPRTRRRSGTRRSRSLPAVRRPRPAVFAPSRYLHWARRFYGQVEFDLATSGFPTVPPASSSARFASPVASVPPTTRGLGEPAPERSRRTTTSPGEALPALGTTHALWLACESITFAGRRGPRRAAGVRAARPHCRRGRRQGRPRRADPRRALPLDPERVARAMTPRTRAVIVSNLHNPSGARAGDDAASRDGPRRRGARRLPRRRRGVCRRSTSFADGNGVFRGSARKLAPERRRRLEPDQVLRARTRPRRLAARDRGRRRPRRRRHHRERRHAPALARARRARGIRVARDPRGPVARAHLGQARARRRVGRGAGPVVERAH